MHLAWIGVFSLLSVFITPTETTIGSWDLSTLPSALAHGDYGIESETIVERSLSRNKRAAAVIPEYTVDIEISFPDPSFASLITQFITKNLTFPILLNSSDTEITGINVTTACNYTGVDAQCSCESGYKWPDDICASYSPCPGSDASNCNCIKGSNINVTQYCQAKTGKTVNINMSLKLLENFTSDFKYPTSAKYKKYKADLELQFTNAYKSLPGFKSAVITGFRPGSVLADYTVVTEPVTSSAMRTANTNLINSLSSSYPVSSIQTIIHDWSTITVNPQNIFPKDTVTLTCTVNVTSYTSASWYVNGTDKIVNSSYSSYSTVATASTIQSILTINRAQLNDSGTFYCRIDLDSNTYEAWTDITVQPMELTVLNTNITCDNTEVSVIQCCTQGGNASFDLTCQNTSGPFISGITKSSPTCKAYTIKVDLVSCPRGDTSSYSCTCSTTNGAAVTQIVQLRYQAAYAANIIASAEEISEGKVLTLQCKCNATSVQSMSWYFITNTNSNNSIDAKYYTAMNLASCNSTLTIPSDVTSVSWNGTYNCLVNNGWLSTSRAIQVFRLAKPSQISRSPITQGFNCKTPIEFSCCIDNIREYQSNGSLQITTAKNIITQDMGISGRCFKKIYTPGLLCEDFTARCTITNLLNDHITSDIMTLTYIADAKCTVGHIGNIGSVITVACQDEDSNLSGTKNYTCQPSQTPSGSSADWTQSNSSCVSAKLNKLKDQVDVLNGPGSDTNVPAVLGDLSNTVSSEKENITSSVNNIQLVVNILKLVENVTKRVEPQVMQDFLQTVSIVVDNSSTATWNEVPNKVQQSSNLLQSVERFAEKLIITGSVEITNNTNVQLIGNVISNLSSNYVANFNFSHTNNLTGNVVINRTSLNSISPNATVISIAYATLKDILNTPADSINNETLNGLVMTTTITNKSSNFQIGMDFKKSKQTLNKATCVFWNFSAQAWDGSGCRLISLGENVSCTCDHLTSFSILMSLDNSTTPILDYITYIGVGISILSLVICIVIEAVVWKSVTKNKTSYMRHMCIINIAVTLLMADIWFIIGAAMTTPDKVEVCVAATFFAHLFYLCVFFWMLTMGLILFYRLMCVFHDLSKTIMMGISFFLGYGCPIIISVITVAVTQPSKKYLLEKGCWLNIVESKAFLAFIVPALTILLVNFITLFVVIVKVLRPSVGDKPKKEEKSSLNHIAKCILILTPLLGLTWGLGIGLMISQSVVIKGFFAALNSLQGLFILLFGCLMDKKVRDSLLSRFSVSRWSSQQTKTSNLQSSTEPVFSKGVINLFAKKGIYNISSAQVSSSGDMASSNSYSLLS